MSAEDLSEYEDEYAPGLRFEEVPGDPFACASTEHGGDIGGAPVGYVGSVTTWLQAQRMEPTHVDDFGYLHGNVFEESGKSQSLIIPEWLPAFDSRYGKDVSYYLLGLEDHAYVAHVLAISDSGEVGYVMPCVWATESRQALEAFGDSLAPKLTGSEALLAVIGHAPRPNVVASDLAVFLDQDIAWHDLEPERRILDVDTTPPDVMDSLQEVVVSIKIPDAWRGESTAVLCTKIPGLGWNECASLDMPDELDRTGGYLEMFAYVDPGMRSDGMADLDIALLNASASLQGDSAVVGAIEVDPKASDARGIVASFVISTPATPAELLTNSTAVEVSLTEEQR